MKLSRLLLPAIGLIACVCAVSVAASLSDTPITVSPQVLEKLAELPAPPSQMLGESTNSEIPQPPTRGQSSIQSQRLDLSSLPTQSNRSIAPAPVPIIGSPPVSVTSGGFLPDTSSVLPASPRVRLRRPSYQQLPAGQITPALPLDSLPNPGPAGARRSAPTTSTSPPSAPLFQNSQPNIIQPNNIQSPIAPPIFPSHETPAPIPYPNNGVQFQPPAASSSLVHGQSCPCGCQPRCTTQTITVPTWETRYVNSLRTRYRPETRQRRSKRYYTVYDDVPKVETYTVKVPEPRTRTYTVNIPREYQEAKQRNFTVMVAKPAQREETVERVETFKIPIVTPYTVMVPERQQYQETTYKTVTDRVPVQKKYVENVTKTKKRVVTTYEKRPFTKKVRTPIVKMVEETRTRPKVRYKSEVVTRTFEEPEVYYYDDIIKKKVTRYRTVNRQRTVQQKSVAYDQKRGTYTNPETDQRVVPYSEKVDYKVTAPYTETVDETYYVNEPFVEEIIKTFPTKRQVERTVNKTYQVKLPETTHISQSYTVRVPYEVMETRYRTVTRQAPVTKYRVISRDLGRWERKEVTCPTCSVHHDGCGCTSCSVGSQTNTRNVWCPRVVSQRIPYTDYRDVQQRLPYQVPVLKYRNETRVRNVPKTRYRNETRTANLKVYDLVDSQRTEKFSVTKYRWVPKTRKVTLKRVREEIASRNLPFVKYETVDLEPLPIEYRYKEPKVVNENVVETYQERVPYLEEVEVKVKVAGERTKKVTREFIVRVPEPYDEEYTVKVAKTEYIEKDVTEYVEFPVNKEEEYTEVVPEFRTRIEYKTVERKVPVFTTKYKTVMVPKIKTRTSYRTETRTVSDSVMKTYMTFVPEIKTKTIYETKVRNVPQTRTELYWENVPKTRYRTVMIKVPRQIAREHVQTYTVNVPYQVRVCVPVQVCKMVQKTITIPAEECCETCWEGFEDINDVSRAYLQYGYRRWCDLLGK